MKSQIRLHGGESRQDLSQSDARSPILVRADSPIAAIGDNTIIVLGSDHGRKLGEFNGWGKMTNHEIDTIHEIHSPSMPPRTIVLRPSRD